ncbi:hypothetical protein GWI33_005192 [Rhynchophorus ferrugineus]|uniref:Uncharacterized protein n=1 Tax=Rhynchophorus ferrugineus TaxID=354439 RepID=A0A834ME15_RHYFE|nr:hypothetical protein GWI33_005192 [Rhynchophorus ferrugineus]
MVYSAVKESYDVRKYHLNVDEQNSRITRIVYSQFTRWTKTSGFNFQYHHGSLNHRSQTVTQPLPRRINRRYKRANKGQQGSY